MINDLNLSKEFVDLLKKALILIPPKTKEIFILDKIKDIWRELEEKRNYKEWKCILCHPETINNLDEKEKICAERTLKYINQNIITVKKEYIESHLCKKHCEEYKIYDKINNHHLKLKEKEEIKKLIEIEDKKKRLDKMYNLKGSPSINLHLLKEIITNDDFENMKKLSYKVFLTTIYWKTIVRYILYKNNYQCQVCNNTDIELNVHHKTYENHPFEIYHLNDLILLCKKCHNKIHNKLTTGD